MTGSSRVFVALIRGHVTPSEYVASVRREVDRTLIRQITFYRKARGAPVGHGEGATA